MDAPRTAISLSELTGRVARAIAAAPGLAGVWVTAETSDVRCSGGHCYMELIEKDAHGIAVAKCRAAIWASTYVRLDAAFHAATGTRLRSDIRIMARVSVSYHAVYGFSLVINDIDPSYTMGELERKRRMILEQLAKDGIAGMNRALPWSATPCRVAVVSAAGAAGYGDFIEHLYKNPRRLRFDTTLFPAAMQGVNTVPSVISALEAIMERIDHYDCVVIIRGGGAVSDLTWFDDYDLAAHVAQFPLPVIVGIGHERDVTVLDYIANTRVKTPTAAAEVLIGRMTEALGRVQELGMRIHRAVTERVDGQQRQLAYYAGTLPALAANVVERNSMRLGEHIPRIIADAVGATLRRRADRLTAIGEILDTLSPEATLRRGYSITRIGGHAITSAADAAAGTTIETTLANGKIISTVN